MGYSQLQCSAPSAFKLRYGPRNTRFKKVQQFKEYKNFKRKIFSIDKSHMGMQRRYYVLIATSTRMTDALPKIVATQLSMSLMCNSIHTSIKSTSLCYSEP